LSVEPWDGIDFKSPSNRSGFGGLQSDQAKEHKTSFQRQERLV
jgi:hypothetical protein